MRLVHYMHKMYVCNYRCTYVCVCMYGTVCNFILNDEFLGYLEYVLCVNDWLDDLLSHSLP